MKFHWAREGRCGPIGIDICADAIHAAQVSWTRQGPVLRGGVSVQRTAQGAIQAEEAGALSECLSRAGLLGTDVCLIAPHTDVLTSCLELPPRGTDAPVEHLARLELARIHKREPQRFEMGLWDMPTPDRRPGVAHFMGVALPCETGDMLSGALQSAGLRVVLIEVRMCALARAGAAVLVGGPALGGILQVSEDCAYVTLLHLSGTGRTVPIYERRVEDAALRTLHESMGKRLGISPAGVRLALRSSPEDPSFDAPTRDLLRHVRSFQGEYLDVLVPEVQRAFAYAQQLYPSLPVTTLLVTGEGESMRGLKERLSGTLGLDVRSLLPRDVVGSHPDSKLALDATLTTALGAAMSVPGAGSARRAA